MEIGVSEEGCIRLRKVFDPIVLETESGEKLSVCMRDGGFDLRAKDLTVKSEDSEYFTLYHIQDGLMSTKIMKQSSGGVEESGSL